MTADTTQGRIRSNRILLVLCAASFMAMLDVFVVNVALVEIGDSLDSPLSDLSWILNGYTIVYAALLIPAGRLSDRYGRRAGFVVGLLVFTAASLACALSPTLWMLVLFRIVQATGAAALTPTSLGLLLTALPPERRAAGVKVWATTTSLAAAVGPVLGGALVNLGWQWVFLINVPVGVVALLGAVTLIPESKSDTATRIPDLLGAVLLAIALGALSLALVKGAEWGWLSVTTGTAVAIAVIASATMVYRTRNHPAPIVDPALLRVRSFFWANVTALLFCVAFGAVLPSVILRLQTGAGFDALTTGLAVAPSPFMVPIFAAIGQRLARVWSPRIIIALGNSTVALGALTLAMSAKEDVSYAAGVLPGWLMVGIGVGLCLPTLLATATVPLPPEHVSTGSAVVNTSRQMGYVFGVTMLVAILGTISTTADATESFQHSWWAIAAVALLSSLSALGIDAKPGRPQVPAKCHNDHAGPHTIGGCEAPNHVSP